MKKILLVAVIGLVGLSSCLPDTGGKVPAFDNMVSQTQANLDSAGKQIIQQVKDSSGTLLDRLDRDSIDIEIGNTGEKFTLKK